MQTREKTFGITCPSCGNTFEESLNTAIFSSTLDRQMILKNEFGKIICPKCGHEFILNAILKLLMFFQKLISPSFVDFFYFICIKHTLVLLKNFLINFSYKC